MKKNSMYLFFIVLCSCSLLAEPIPEPTISIPQEWRGYYGPQSVKDTDIVRDYIKIDDFRIYIKNIAFDLDTGVPYNENGSVYQIEKIIVSNKTTFQVLVKSILNANTATFAFSITQKKGTIFPPSSAHIEIVMPTPFNAADGTFDDFIKNAFKRKFSYSTYNLVIPSIPPFTLDPDADTRPFLTKVANGQDFSWWTIAPNIENAVLAALKFVNMGVGSRIAALKECAKDASGNPIIFKGERVFAYAYKDTDPLSKPSFPIFYKPINSKYGYYWFKGGSGNGTEKLTVYLPVMLAGDFIFGGYIKFDEPGKPNKPHPDDFKFFENIPISSLMKYNNILRRAY